MLELLIESIVERNAGGVAGGVARLIRGGALAPGARLPTVRDFASALGTSPTTVSQAWALLARAGLISPQGRRGTFVTDRRVPDAISAWRVRRTMGSPGHPALDLSTGTPDLDLLPDISAALTRIVATDHTRDYYDAPVIKELEDVLRERWPYDPEALTIVDGAMDALDRIAAEHVHLGSRVLVENPAYPPLLDVLELIGADRIALDLDSEGVTPDSLRAGLAKDPAAVFLQPRAHNPTGVSLSSARAQELAGLLRGTKVLIVEDDHCGDIAGGPAMSLGTWLPESTIHIQSFSKSYGPDLRLAAVSAPAAIIAPLENRRLLGPGWSSRLLQQILLDLLTDPATQSAVTRARTVYRERREALVKALGSYGIEAGVGDGINTWIRVSDEQSTLLAMATHGVGVAAGSPFFTTAPRHTDHVRVTSGLIRDDHDRVARLLASVEPVTRDKSPHPLRTHPPN